MKGARARLGGAAETWSFADGSASLTHWLFHTCASKARGTGGFLLKAPRPSDLSLPEMTPHPSCVTLNPPGAPCTLCLSPQPRPWAPTQAGLVASGWMHQGP